MDFSFDNLKDSLELLKYVVENEYGAVVIAPSDEKASRWGQMLIFLVDRKK